ncbi:MAG TPA: glycosyltransferase [Gemmatimonadales bacterium]|nr:glycosyltransferase [Gemmatimonadales bacterium]
MKVAIVHYWLVERRGGERVVEALCGIYPQADVFTNVFDPEPFAETLKGHRVTTSFVNRLPLARKLLAAYLPLMPIALEQLDLRGYDLVISCESGPAKGVIVNPDALHVCYCFSPMRYVWDLQHSYLAEAGPLGRMLMRPVLHYLRAWDYLSAQRPDVVIALSEHVRDRVAKYWRRDAQVLPPPVDVGRFAAASRHRQEGAYYLYAGHLAGYKRPDLAVEAFNQLGLPLVVAGVGPDARKLRRMAGPNVSFRDRLTDDELARTVAGCRALVFPGEEDFGIVAVEAMAAGRPVIAYRRGGLLDTVVEGVTGLFFDAQSAPALADAVRRFEQNATSFDAGRIAAHALAFDREAFDLRFREVVENCLREHQEGRRPAW